MPSLVTGFGASLAGWMIDGLFPPYLGTGATLISFVGRKWSIDPRGRSGLDEGGCHVKATFEPSSPT